MTGISMITVALAPKRLELLHELVPAPAVLAVLLNPTSPYVKPQTKDVMASARGMEASPVAKRQHRTGN